MGGRGLMLSNGSCIHGKGVHDDRWSQEACYLMLYTPLAYVTFRNEYLPCRKYTFSRPRFRVT